MSTVAENMTENATIVNGPFRAIMMQSIETMKRDTKTESSDLELDKEQNSNDMDENQSNKKSNLSHKTGRFVFPNGDEYEGSYQLNQSGSIERHGAGVFKTIEGVVYSGDWLQDKMNGKGVFTHPNGCQYEGDFVGGYFEGHGKYTWPDGSFY